MFVVFLFSWYRLELLACSTLEQISEIKNCRIFNGVSWTSDRPNAIPLPTQHNRSSEKSADTRACLYYCKEFDMIMKFRVTKNVGFFH
jgi:hypothetical protein